jgi:hydrogenase expression/formation protein HypE
VASVLNEIAESAKAGIRIHETSLPIRDDVKGACEILGLDPLYVANEGKLLAFVPKTDSGRVLAAMRNDPCGRDSAIIGEVVSEHPGVVVMTTRIGANRVVDMLSGEQLPRIC